MSRDEERLAQLKRKLAAGEGQLGYRENVEVLKAEIARLGAGEPLTTSDRLALAADTQRLIRRTSEVLDQCPLMGPKLHAELFSPLRQINDALRDHVEELEAVAVKLRA